MNAPIVFLLSLILVALVASNQRSAAAVKTVLAYLLITAIVGAVWVLWVSAVVAILYRAPEFKGYVELISWQIIIILWFSLAPWFLIWRERESILRAIEDSKLTAAKRACIFGVKCFLGLLYLWLPIEIRNTGYGAQVAAVAWAVALVTSGGILLACASRPAAVVHDVWFKPLPEWEVQYALRQERDRIIESERQKRFPDITKCADPVSKVDANEDFRATTVNPVWHRWNQLRLKTESRFQQQGSRLLPAIRTVFWYCVWCAFAVICVAMWTPAKALLDYLKFFRGHEWVASTLLALACMCAAGMLAGLTDRLKDQLAGRAIADLLKEISRDSPP